VSAPESSPLRLAVLISGAGTTLENLLEKIAARQLAAQVRVVVSSNPAARGLEHAHRAIVPTTVLERRSFDSEAAFSEAIFNRCRQASVDFVVMGGFLKHVSIPPDFENRVINIHPALIPACCGKGFYGLRVHAAVLASAARESGCTVHFVDDEYDHGPILLQRTVPVERDDTPERLAARVFAAECEAYPEALRLLASGRVRVENGRVTIAERA